MLHILKVWREDKESTYTKRPVRSCRTASEFVISGPRWTPALIDRSQLLHLGSARYSSLFNRLGSRSGIDDVEDRRTNEDREEEGDYIHAYTEEQRLPATDSIEG